MKAKTVQSALPKPGSWCKIQPKKDGEKVMTGDKEGETLKKKKIEKCGKLNEMYRITTSTAEFSGDTKHPYRKYKRRQSYGYNVQK